jgi:hypothetical protein
LVSLLATSFQQQNFQKAIRKTSRLVIHCAWLFIFKQGGHPYALTEKIIPAKQVEEM